MQGKVDSKSLSFFAHLVASYFLQVSSLSFRSKQEHTMSQMTKCIPMGISFEIIQVNKEAKKVFLKKPVLLVVGTSKAEISPQLLL